MNWSELRFESREEWLEARRSLGVGASEVASLFSDPTNPLKGVSSYDSPVSLSWRKRGLIGPEERSPEDEEHLEWSTFIEPAIAAWFEQKVMPSREPFASLHDPGQWTIQIPKGPNAPPIFCTLDRVILGADGTPVSVLEIKNASLFMGDAWSEEPPLPYVLQVQTQLAVTGLPYGYVCAPIGGRAPKWAKVMRNEQVISIILDRVAKFWATVQAGIDPPMDAHPATSSALIHRWPLDDGNRAALTEAEQTAWDERTEWAKRKANAELEYDLRTHALKAAIGEASFGDFPDGRSLSLKTDRAGRRNLREAS
jgi:predicted phage-related endonuclease